MYVTVPLLALLFVNEVLIQSYTFSFSHSYFFTSCITLDFRFLYGLNSHLSFFSPVIRFLSLQSIMHLNLFLIYLFTICFLIYRVIVFTLISPRACHLVKLNL